MKSKGLRGRFTKSIRVQSNDPVTPTLFLKLMGECKSYVDVNPLRASMGRVIEGEEREFKIKIKNNTEAPLEIGFADDPKPPVFQRELIQKVAGQEYELVLRLVPPYKVGPARERIRLTTNVAKQESVDVWAMATVTAKLEVQPSSLKVNMDRGDRPYRSLLRINNFGKAPIKILDAVSDNPAFQLSLTEVTVGKAYNVQVEIPPTTKILDSGNTITLKTDDPANPSLEVSVKPFKPAPPRKPPEPAQSMVGRNSPAFAMKLDGGGEVTNASIKDGITVLNFFAPDCGFCRKQIGPLEEMKKAFADKGVRWVHVAEKMRRVYTEDQVRDTLKQWGATTEASSSLAFDLQNQVGRKFFANSFPTMVILGKSGKVEAVNVGNKKDLQKLVTKQLENMLAGKPVPVSAVPRPVKPTLTQTQ